MFIKKKKKIKPVEDKTNEFDDFGKSDLLAEQDLLIGVEFQQEMVRVFHVQMES